MSGRIQHSAQLVLPRTPLRRTLGPRYSSKRYLPSKCFDCKLGTTKTPGRRDNDAGHIGGWHGLGTASGRSVYEVFARGRPKNQTGTNPGAQGFISSGSDFDAEADSRGREPI